VEGLPHLVEREHRVSYRKINGDCTIAALGCRQQEHFVLQHETRVT